jgi:hypothetical protein
MLVSNELERRMWKGMAMSNLEYYLGVVCKAKISPNQDRLESIIKLDL